MPGVAVPSPRQVESPSQVDRARREPCRAGALRCKPNTVAPAVAVVVFVAEAAAVVRLVVGVVLLVPLPAAIRPTAG